MITYTMQMSDEVAVRIHHRAIMSGMGDRETAVYLIERGLEALDELEGFGAALDGQPLGVPYER